MVQAYASHFGAGTGRISESRALLLTSIARRFGATFTYVRSSEGWRYWFSAPSSSPQTRDLVLGELRRLDGEILRGGR